MRAGRARGDTGADGQEAFAKIDEEFDELKAAVLSVFYGLDVVPSDRPDLKNIGDDETKRAW